MARKPRIEYAGAFYHVMSRGNRGDSIFLDDTDRELWLRTLGQACNKTGWRVHAYVQMVNHYHLLLETPEPNLVAGMKWMQGTYTQRVNRIHNLYGHLLQGRYKALPIDTEDGKWFRTVVDYIHLNPVRSGLVQAGKDMLGDYVWSSFKEYLSSPNRRPFWLTVNLALGELGLEDTPKGRSNFELYTENLAEKLETRNGDALRQGWERIRRGWFLGDDSFQETLVIHLPGLLKGKKAESFGGAAKREHGIREAQKLLATGLRILRLDAGMLPGMRKGSEEKAFLAWLLRRRTTADSNWIAGKIYAGHHGNISRLVKQAESKEAGPMGKWKREAGRMLKCGD